MFHDRDGIFDSLDVLVDVDVLVRRMKIGTGIGEAGQDTGYPDMSQDRPFGRHAVDDGQFAIDLGCGGDDGLADILFHADLVGRFGAVEGPDLDMAEAVPGEMVLQLADRGLGLDVGDQTEVQPGARFVGDDRLGARAGVAGDDSLDVGGRLVAAGAQGVDAVAALLRERG